MQTNSVPALVALNQRFCLQSWGRAVSVPGRALAGVVELLQGHSGLAPDAHQLLVDFHADVVQLLTSEGAAPAD